MAVKAEQLPALTHEQRVRRLKQLATDLARAVDVSEEQRRSLEVRGHASEPRDPEPQRRGWSADTGQHRKR